MKIRGKLICSFLLITLLPMLLLVGSARVAYRVGMESLVDMGNAGSGVNFLQMLIMFMLVLFLTGGLLMLWIYRSIVYPINVLKNATHRMRDGDLDFSINTKSKDEIGELCQDFDDMRLRLKESIEMRLKYEREMRELLSNISHDLKTPLTAIEGYTEGILDGVATTPEKQQRYLRTIHKKAKEMAAMVDELSTSSKIENGIVPYNFQKMRVDMYFSDCVEELRMDLGMEGILLEYSNDVAWNVLVEIDPEQLKRVIHNIVGNSVKYIGDKNGIISISIIDEKYLPKNIEYSEKSDIVDGYYADFSDAERAAFGVIEKETDDSDYQIRVEIRDNGQGIEKDDLPHIFERLYRADASRHSRDGSGLGLAIAAKIIADHGGRIWAESTVGEGTSIFFTLCRRKLESQK